MRYLWGSFMRRVLFSVTGATLAILTLFELWYCTSVSSCISHAALFGSAAALTFATMILRFSPVILYVLLVASTVVMASFFGLFFINDFDINYLTSSMPGVSLHLLFLLMAAFFMVPVVAHYSCRLKVGGCESYFEEEEASLEIGVVQPQ